ncbi:MAG: DUF4293 domain-containing protein [Bacteroidales bacterium]|nr:DUF4293 domain-containing protein [Bacteroidales bacterium]
MIQRIQTVYLFVISLLFLLLFFVPFANFIVDNQIVAYTYQGLGNGFQSTNGIIPAFPVIIFIIIVFTVSFISIFLYKKRLLQIKLGRINYIFIISLIIYVVLFIFRAKTLLNTEPNYSFGLLLPLISIILNYLAIRAIRKDDNLIKSVDRIR